MIKRTDILDALTKCVGYDPIHAPKHPRIMEEAWVEHFEMFPALTRDDLLAAVRDYYKTPQRPWPQPADLSTIARSKLRDAAERAPLAVEGPPAGERHREKCMTQIRDVVARQSRKWSVS